MVHNKRHKLAMILFFICAACIMLLPATGLAMTGTGTTTDPYLIYDATDLQNIKNNLTANYKLANDIDMAGVSYVPVGNSTIPFKGTLDGNGYTIKNLSINSTTAYTGLFGYIYGGTIQNINIIEPNITSTQTYTGALAGYIYGAIIKNINITVAKISSTQGGTGALAGYASATQISNVHVRKADGNSVISGVLYVGGLVGQLDTSTIATSSSNIDILGTTSVGGLVGYYSGVGSSWSINKCYATGNVTGTGANNTYIGGFIGRIYCYSPISNSFANGKVSGGSNVGGFAGSIEGSSTAITLKLTNCYSVGQVSGITKIGGFAGGYGSNYTITNCYYDAVTSKQNVRSGLEVAQSRFTNAMVKQANYTGWDFSSTWAIDEESSYPYLRDMEKPSGVTATTLNTISGSGTANDPYLISTPQQLQNIIYELNANYKIVNDINMIGFSYKPVGNNTTPFKGTLDGNGYTIKNLSINSTTAYTGLFGYIYGGTIQNINIIEPNITSTQTYTGALAGYIYGAIIKNINITVAKISSTQGGTGALAGYASATQISNVHVRKADGNSVISGVLYVGGLVGQLDTSTIATSSSNIDILGTTSVGGLVGYYSGVGSSWSINKCYATGNVTGTGANNSYIGGFIGRIYCYSPISNSFANGKVSGGSNVGGFAGSIEGTSTAITLKLTNCYSVGQVSGTTKIGGFAGGYGSNYTITNCYYDSSKISGSDAKAKAMTHEASFHQATYAGFDFGTIWKIEEGITTPYLRDMPIPDPVILPSADADLSALTVSQSTISPSFDRAVTEYTVTLANVPEIFNVTPVASHTAAVITVNGQSVLSGNPSQLIPLSIGNNSIAIVVTAENGTTTKTYNITVNVLTDTTPPVVTPSPSGSYYQLPQTVTLTADEPAVIYYTTDGSDPATSETRQQYTGPISINENTVLKFYGVDAANNQSAVKSENYIIDGAAPVVTIDSPAQGQTIGTNTPVLHFTIDEANLDRIIVKIDGAEVVISSGETLNGLTDGTHTIRVEAIDKAGNTGFQEVSFTVDTRLMDVTATPAGGTYYEPQTVTLNATKPGTIKYTTDGSDPVTNGILYEQPLDISINTLLKFVAIDAQGNPSPVRTEQYIVWKKAVVTITETKGISRTNEPVEMTLNLPEAKSDGSDIRVVDTSYHELPYQIISKDGSGNFTLTFFTDVEANSAADYYILYRNALANAPDYGNNTTLLNVQGKIWQTNDVYIQWGGTAYQKSGTNSITDLRLDQDNDDSPMNDYDNITDDMAWSSFYGYLGAETSTNPLGFGQGEIKISQNGPVFTEFTLGNARIRSYKGVKNWIVTNGTVDGLYIFERAYTHLKFGYAEEFEIPDNGEGNVGPWAWYGSGDNPGYMAYRQNDTGRVFGGIGVNAATYQVSAKESGAYDRTMSFDDSSNRQDAKIYWYADTSDNYQGIELLSNKVLNPVQIHINYL